MSERWIVLEPIDVLFFRDLRPFGAGSEHHAASLFPPYPSVTAGALRTVAMAAHGVQFDRPGSVSQHVARVWGRPGESAFSARLKGPFICHQGEILFPLPADLDFREGKVVRLSPLDGRDTDFFTSSLDLHGGGLRPLWWGENKGFQQSGEGPCFLAAADMERYLKGPLPERAISASELWTTEARFGIALGVHRTVREGMLYSLKAIRLQKEVGLALAVGGEGESPLPEEGLLRLGGEGRMARWRFAGTRRWPEPGFREGRFTWTLVTPAIFRDSGDDAPPWLPANVRREARGYVLEEEGLRARLVAVCLQSLSPVSGWDIVKKEAKPLRWAVPAGTVYYFELESGDPLKCHAQSVSAVGANEGFGIVLVGGWDYVQA